MPRPTKFLATLRDVVRREVADVMQTMFSLAGATKPTKRRRRKVTNGRRKRRGPGRPPKNAS